MRPEPDIKGDFGEAWRQDLVALHAKYPDLNQTSTTLVSYHLNCPKAHPAWHWWAVSLVHLRDQEGATPANKHYPEAEYEICVLAFNPEKGEPVLGVLPYSFLMPPDVMQQFHGVTDEGAIEITTELVRACCYGKISPDQDYRSYWRRYVQAGVEHFKGEHAVGSG